MPTLNKKSQHQLCFEKKETFVVAYQLCFDKTGQFVVAYI